MFKHIYHSLQTVYARIVDAISENARLFAASHSASPYKFSNLFSRTKTVIINIVSRTYLNHEIHKTARLENGRIMLLLFIFLLAVNKSGRSRGGQCSVARPTLFSVQLKIDLKHVIIITTDDSQFTRKHVNCQEYFKRRRPRCI